MQNEIKIHPNQIQYTDQHGIYFINDDGDSDFLSFALSYECIMHFAIVIEPYHFNDDESYDRFLSIMPTRKIAAIHDDQFTDYDIVFIQGGTGDVLYTLEIDNTADYQRIKTKIEAAGWELCRTTELT